MDARRMSLGLLGLLTGLMLLMSLDVLGGYGGVELLVAGLMHNAPTLLVGVGWWAIYRRFGWGGWYVAGLGIVATIFFKTYQDPVTFLLVSGPLFVAGGLVVWGKRS